MIYKAPDNISKKDINKPSVFLAGSIEMGNAENWQEEMTLFFYKMNWHVFNPRRDDWDSSWKQEYSNPQFSQQVNWELNALEKCDLIILYLDPNTKSPISLLELGLYATSGKLRVICPEGFWRRGNVEIVCDKYGIPFYDNLDVFKRHFSQSYFLHYKIRL